MIYGEIDKLVWDAVWSSVHKSIRAHATIPLMHSVTVGKDISDYISRGVARTIDNIIYNYNERIQEKKTN